MFKNFTVLVEEDYASNNFCGYIPELRLNVVGETEEEILEYAKDLISLELEKSPNHKTFSSKVVSVQVEINPEKSEQEDYQAAV